MEIIKAVKGNPFEFPFAGKMRTQRVERGLCYIIGMNEVETFEIAPGSSGVIREIFIACGWDYPPPFYENVKFQVFYDGEEEPTINVPVGSLVGYQLPFAVGDSGPVFDTKRLSVVANGRSANGKYGFFFRIPIPYTNGIKIRLLDEQYATTSMPLYTTVVYQDSLPACWNRNYRLSVHDTQTRAIVPGITAEQAGTISSSGTAVTGVDTAFDSELIGRLLTPSGGSPPYNEESRIVTAVTDATHLTVDAAWGTDLPALTKYRFASMLTFLDRPAGKRGVVLMDTANFNSVDEFFLEGNPQFHIDRETVPSYVWSGGEDYWGGAFYFDGGLLRGDHGGLIERITGEGQYDISVFRVHESAPIFYSDGIIGRWRNDYQSGDSLAGDTDCWWSCFYYEEV